VYVDGFHTLSSNEYPRVPDGVEAWNSDQIRDFLVSAFLDERIKDKLRHELTP